MVLQLRLQVAPRAFGVWRWLVVVCAALLLLGSVATPVAAVPTEQTANPQSALRVSHTYDRAAQESPLKLLLTRAAVDRDRPPAPRDWAAPPIRSSAEPVLAAEGEAEVAAIKAGSAGGETAGKAFPQSVRGAALEENPSTCVYCHMETEAPQVDHAIPRALGGNATLDNAQTTCWWCNASKGAREFPVNPPPGFRGAWPPWWWGL